MPVTARLLQRLHESLGDDATNDLFTWWEEAATVNRAAVREVADLYFAKFEARLEKGLSEIRSEMAMLRSDMGTGGSEIRSEMGMLRSDMDKGFSEIRSEMAMLRSDMGTGGSEVRLEMGMLRSDMDKGFATLRSELDSRLANQRADLVKWMFMFWLGTIIPLAGLLIALTKR